MKSLTHRQRLFIEAYISTRGNGTEAMRRAGYRGSDKALAAHASRMVGNGRVAVAIRERTEKAIKSVGGPTAEEIIAAPFEVLDGEQRGYAVCGWLPGTLITERGPDRFPAGYPRCFRPSHLTSWCSRSMCRDRRMGRLGRLSRRLGSTTSLSRRTRPARTGCWSPPVVPSSKETSAHR